MGDKEGAWRVVGVSGTGSTAYNSPQLDNGLSLDRIFWPSIRSCSEGFVSSFSLSSDSYDILGMNKDGDISHSSSVTTRLFKFNILRKIYLGINRKSTRLLVC